MIQRITSQRSLTILAAAISLASIVWFWYCEPLIQFLNASLDEQLFTLINPFQDDAFFYLEIAQNILHRSISSFDGNTLTNGYQPLWMLVLVGIGIFIPIGTPAFILMLMGMIAVLVLVGAAFFFSLQLKIYPGSGLIIPLLVYAFGGFWLSVGGMEIGLVFFFTPLFLLLFRKAWYSSRPQDFFAAGLGASMLVLSRLDTIFLVILISVALLKPKDKQSNLLKNGLSYLAGFVPLIAYLSVNQAVFGNIVPISGLAKSLLLEDFVFSWRGISSIWQRVSSRSFLLFAVGITFISGPVIAIHWLKSRRFEDWILFATTITPFIFFGYYLFHSDWPFWVWYYYPFIISFSFSLIFLEMLASQNVQVSGKLINTFNILAAACLLVLVGYKSIITPRQFKPYPALDSAIQVQEFTRTHPGVYAMGDRAGAPAFLITQPLIQLEGLVGNQRMLANIDQQRDLLEVMNEYRVDYYVVVNPQMEGDCWQLSEPRQPGNFAPRMSSKLCDTPVITFNTADGPTMIYKISDLDLRSDFDQKTYGSLPIKQITP